MLFPLAGDLRSLAADQGYDKQPLRESLRDLGICPLIKRGELEDRLAEADEAAKEAG